MCCKYISIVTCPIKMAFCSSSTFFFLIIFLFLTIFSTWALSLRSDCLITFLLYSSMLRGSMRNLRLSFLFHYLLIIMFVILFDRLFVFTTLVVVFFSTLLFLPLFFNWLIRLTRYWFVSWCCLWLGCLHIFFFNYFIDIIRFLSWFGLRIQLSLQFL